MNKKKDRLMYSAKIEKDAKLALKRQIKAGIDAYYKKVGLNHCIYERSNKPENKKEKG